MSQESSNNYSSIQRNTDGDASPDVYINENPQPTVSQESSNAHNSEQQRPVSNRPTVAQNRNPYAPTSAAKPSDNPPPDQEENVFENLIGNFSEILTSNKFTKALMTHAATIMIIMVAIYIFATAGAYSRNYPVGKFCSQLTTLPEYLFLILAIPCLVQKKFWAMAIAFTSVSIITLITVIDWFTLGQVVNIGLFSVLAIICYKVLYKNGDFKTLKENASNKISNLKSSPQIMVRCGKCGGLCSEVAEFCSDCGVSLKNKINDGGEMYNE